MTINNTTQPNFFDASTVGRASSEPFVDTFHPRDPTTSDIQYPVQKKWLNTNTNAFWELKNFTSSGGVTLANWVLLSNQAAATETLTTDDAVVVPPTNNNINLFGDGVGINTTGNAGTSTVTIHLKGDVATTYVEDVGTATPSSNILNVLGSTNITTTGAGNTITIDLINNKPPIQGLIPDAHTAPGTSPVVPDSAGDITITGGQVAAGTTTHVIRTDSLAANTMTVEIQRSQAVGSSTVGDNGVSHFDSAIFSVDSNAFVSLAPAFFQTGTFTPTLAFGGASTGITYSRQSGRYQLVGNVVYFQLAITLTNKGSSTGDATVGGLPFTIINDATYSGDAQLGPSLVTFDVNYTFTYVQCIANTTTLGLLQAGSAQGLLTLKDTNFANSSDFGVWGFYFKQ